MTNLDEPQLLNVKSVAKILSVSTRQVWRLRDSGHIPSPVRLARSIKWRRDELLKWIADGCPSCRPRPTVRQGMHGERLHRY